MKLALHLHSVAEEVVAGLVCHPDPKRHGVADVDATRIAERLGGVEVEVVYGAVPRVGGQRSSAVCARVTSVGMRRCGWVQLVPSVRDERRATTDVAHTHGSTAEGSGHSLSWAVAAASNKSTNVARVGILFSAPRDPAPPRRAAANLNQQVFRGRHLHAHAHAPCPSRPTGRGGRKNWSGRSS